MRGDERFNLPGLLIHDAHLRGVAVGNMRNRMRHIRAKLIGFGKILAVEFLPGKFCKRVGFQRCGKLFAGASAGLARHKRLTGAGSVAGVRRDPGIRALVDDIAAFQRCICNNHLHEHRTDALTNARSARVDMDLRVVFHDQLAAAPVGDADADARVFHCAGNADRLSLFHCLVVIRLDCLKRFDKARFRAHDLAVRQFLSGPNGVAVTDFPRGDADLVGHFVQKRLGGEARLRDAEAAERACGRVVGIIGRALDLEILIVIGAGCVCARAFEHRAAQRSERAGVGVDLGLDALNNAVFIAAHGEVHPERVALGMDEQRLGPRQLDLDGLAG